MLVAVGAERGVEDRPAVLTAHGAQEEVERAGDLAACDRGHDRPQGRGNRGLALRPDQRRRRRGLEQHEAVHGVGPAEGEFERDQRAARVTADVSGVDLQLVQQPGRERELLEPPPEIEERRD